MKKIVFLVMLLTLAIRPAKACADYDPDYDYYNLFMQELITDKQYYPFLLTYGAGFYAQDSTLVNDDNIEQWQQYFGLSYSNTHYLVMKANKYELRSALSGKKVNDKQLSFLTPAFARKYAEALEYLINAKKLERYMTDILNESAWNYNGKNPIDSLNYAATSRILVGQWKMVKDKEIKLRYGYQLVRLAHYKKDYIGAIQNFNIYVEPLKLRPAIYYYALEQKAGATAGLKRYNAANLDFLNVFLHLKSRKTIAYQSIKFSQTVNYSYLLTQMKTTEERNNLFMMMGLPKFNNPLSMLNRIVQTSPDAIQAKVLMARAINQLERSMIPTGSPWEINDSTFMQSADKSFPLLPAPKSANYFQQLCHFSETVATDARLKQPDYWNLSTAYLYFLSKEYGKSRTYLSKVKEINPLYAKQKEDLQLFIDVCEPVRITDATERMLADKHLKAFQDVAHESWYDSKFIFDALGSRYLQQGDYAKSFLMNNNLTALESNPDMNLLDALDSLYQKKDKNDFEKLLVKWMVPPVSAEEKNPIHFDVESYIQNMRGTIYLQRGEVAKALQCFEQVQPNFRQFNKRTKADYGDYYYQPVTNYDGFSGISYRIFGTNIREFFSCSEDTIMNDSFISDFSFIRKEMNKTELCKAILSLQQIANGNSESAAKAAFLLGNFYYNTTAYGYYRQVLSFDRDNNYGEKYHNFNKPDIHKQTYLKFYAVNYFFDNSTVLSEIYLQSALKQTADRELKARILFALSKCEQEMHDITIFNKNGYDWMENSEILIKDRRYFKELAQYSSTAYYQEVKNTCSYFNYYVSRYN